MGTDHYARASLGILCHRARLDGHAGHEFRKDIPFLLLLVASKPGEVVNFFVVRFIVPPDDRGIHRRGAENFGFLFFDAR